MACPESPVVRLRHEIERAEACARQWIVEYGGVPLTWTRVVVVEDRELVDHESLAGARIHTPEEYAPRFARMIEDARGDWANFNVTGVLGDALVLIVEHRWDHPVGHVPAGALQVMVCGPPLGRGFLRYDEPGP